MNKRYLGDSVYASFDSSGQIELTTENGFGSSNIIYLEPEVCDALVGYIYSIRSHSEPVSEVTTTTGRLAF